LALEKLDALSRAVESLGRVVDREAAARDVAPAIDRVDYGARAIAGSAVVVADGRRGRVDALHAEDRDRGGLDGHGTVRARGDSFDAGASGEDDDSTDESRKLSFFGVRFGMGTVRLRARA
jgi:hypothetical protein